MVTRSANSLTPLSPPPPSPCQISDRSLAAASAALAAAKEAASLGVARSYNKVSVTETRRFAGKDIQVGRFKRLWKIWNLKTVENWEFKECENAV